MFNKSGRTNLVYHASIIRGYYSGFLQNYSEIVIIIAENRFESVKKMTRFIAKSTDYSELYQKTTDVEI